MQRLLMVLVSLCLAATAAACSKAATPPPAATSAPAATPTPTPTVDPAALQGYVDKAMLTSDEVGTAKPKTEDFETFFEVPCGMGVTATRVAGQGWSYPSVQGGFLGYSVGAFAPETGSAVVDELRSVLGSCQTWKSPREDLSFTIDGVLDVSRPAGIDNSVSYCYDMRFLTGTMKGRTIVVCDGVLSRGNVAAEIGTYDEKKADAQERLNKLVPLAAAALNRAVPES
jgi:hypothetical protein